MAEAGLSTVEHDQLAQRVAKESPNNTDRRRGYALVNVLPHEAFAQERIPGSINIPQGEEDRFDERFDKDKEIIVYCASFDCHASPSVARELTQRGFTAVRDYEGGIKAWKEAGHPIER